MSGENVDQTERKPYTKPEIIHELELETRAGTPTINDPNILEPLP